MKPAIRATSAGLTRALLAVLTFIHLTSCAIYHPAHRGERVYRNVQFAAPEGHSLAMDLYVPQTAKPAPVVIWIFGGSWKRGYNWYHLNVRELTRYGIAVAAIQYRMSDKFPYPAQLEDCRSSMAWLREHGSEYGVDPERIGVTGESAGGHLAALLGTVEGHPSIKGVFALYPPTDLVVMGRKYASPSRLSDIDRLLGGPVEQKLQLAEDASPVHHVCPSSPPFLLMHGDQDTLVPISESENLRHKLAANHVPVKLIVVPGSPHWFDLDPNQLEAVASFFREHFGH